MTTTRKQPKPIPQTIGDRIVPDPKGEVLDYGTGPIWFSRETCRCGYSMASPGVGYRDEVQRAWICKKCEDPHTAFITEEEYDRQQKARLRYHRATHPQDTVTPQKHRAAAND